MGVSLGPPSHLPSRLWLWVHPQHHRWLWRQVPSAWDLGKGLAKGFGGVWLQVGFLQGGEAESIAVPVRPLWSPRSGFGCSPANPGAVALLRGAGENVGLSLGQPLLPGELLPAHRSPSGGFWLCPPPALAPLGNRSLSTASKAGSSGGGPGGEHQPMKAARKPPLHRAPGRAPCPSHHSPSTLKHLEMAGGRGEGSQCHVSASPRHARGPK